MLEGESLLNDASALVLLRTAIGASAAGISLLHLSGAFLYSVVVAVVIGAVVGYGNLWIRSRATDPTVNTALALTVPFIASFGSGMDGSIWTGRRGRCRLDHRIPGAQIFATVVSASQTGKTGA